MPENPRIEELRRRVLADPASIAFAALAEEFRRVGALADAIETCRTGLLRHPAYLSARVTLGRALIETGEYDAAREELETVLRSAPENLAAIRGLAQINERLGDSGEMDPHLAEMMRQEAARIAALPPPVPVPEPVPEPPPPPEPVLEVLPAEPEPEPEVEPEPEPEVEVEVELELAPEPEPVFAAPDPEPEPAPSVSEPEPEPAFAIQVESEPEPEPVAVQLAPAQPREPAIAIAIAPDPGPDPQVLATLARLERFLAAVETARHA
jgi:tetratricopeptide (TPR) repeat protein